jgi:apolipoprotein N-acyltransferase
MSKTHWRILGALLSGVLVALCFPGEGFPYLSAGYVMPVAYVPLFLALESLSGTGATTNRHTKREGGSGQERSQSRLSKFRTAFLLTWLSGFVTVLIAFFWCTYPAILFGGIPPLAAYPAFTAYAVLSATFFPVIFCPVILNAAASGRRSSQPLAVFALAACATGLEIWTPRFFSWSLGSLMHNSLSISQFASIAGFHGITLIILFSNLAIARSLAHYRTSPVPAMTRIGVVTIVWFGVWLWGSQRLQRLETEFAKGSKTHIGLVQPNFTFDELSSNPERTPGAQTQSLETLLDQSSQLISRTKEKLDLLIWPESVAPGSFAQSLDQLERTKQLSQRTKVPILAQATEFDREEIKQHGYRNATVYSTSFLLRPDLSRSPSYKKWVPIPFGEMVPLEDVFPELGEFVRRNIGNTSKVGRGSSTDALPYSPNEFVAPLICFDAIDSNLPRLQTKFGRATLLANQSNFVWMGHSSAGYQFKELVRFRAIENGRSAVLAANTGPSVIFSPTGREISETTQLLVTAQLSAHAPVWREQTLFTYWGKLPLHLLAGLGLVTIIWQLSNIGRKRQRPHTHR